MREDLPKDTLASIQARAAASATWLDATTFEGLLNSEATRGQTLAQLRQSGAVLGVWSPERDAYLYPPWQLDSSRTLLSCIAEILSLLRGPYGVVAGEPTSGWEEAEWLISPHALLEGGSPSETLSNAQELVLEVARREFSASSPDERW